MISVSHLDFKDYFQLVAEEMENQREYLCELDRKLGDGDHGVTMTIGWRAVQEQLNTTLKDETDIGKLSAAVGMAFLNAVGSSVGPLYASGFIGAGKAAKGKEILNEDDLIAYWSAFIEGIMKRGQAKVGDKTMIDTVAPALAELQNTENASENFIKKFEKVLEEAQKGMESTIGLISKIGRSSRLGERSLNVQDPGATSAYFILATFLKAVQAKSH